MTILTKLKKLLVKSPKILSENGGPITEWEQDFFDKWGEENREVEMSKL